MFDLENNITEQYIRFIIRRNSNILCSIRSFSPYLSLAKSIPIATVVCLAIVYFVKAWQLLIVNHNWDSPSGLQFLCSGAVAQSGCWLAGSSQLEATLPALQRPGSAKNIVSRLKVIQWGIYSVFGSFLPHFVNCLIFI